jgi:hypothetical protein
MTPEQQARLDRMYHRWQTFLRSTLESPEDGTFTAAATLAEAKFKGAVEVLGGAEWSFEDEHVVLKVPAETT